MNQYIKFPQELLSKTNKERQDYFENMMIGHPKLLQCTNKLVKAIKNPKGFSIIMVMGPTGVGKTTLIKKVLNLIIEEMSQDIVRDMSRIPIAALELPSPDSGNFNWKDYYTRALEALDEPLINYKIDYDKYKQDYVEGTKKSSRTFDSTSRALRKSLENALIYRKPIAFLIDEAQHFAKMASGKRLQDQLDTIKSLSNMTGVTHVLVGSYDLINLNDLSGQLSRRTLDIHFERYRANDENDLHAFKSIIYTFQKLLPVEDEPNLIDDWDYIYQYTAGCVGILRDWLVRGLELALENEQKTINHEILAQTSLALRKIEKIAQEISWGEKLLSDNEESTELVRAMIGLNLSGDSDVVNNKKARGNNKPGKRKPSRDPVGVGQNA